VESDFEIHEDRVVIQKAIILAGGVGSRLRPVTLEIPKPLVPVQGKPILTWQVEWLLGSGVQEILVVMPPKWHAAFHAWRSGLGDTGNAVDLWEEPEPMGTMGAVTHHLLEHMGSEPFFVTNGDELKGLDLTKLESAHRMHQPDATIALVRVPNPSDYGVAEMDGYRIMRFHEKPAIPPSTLISSGLYVIEPSAFEDVDRSKNFLMFEKDLFPRLAETGRLGGCALDGPWFDCGTMERWEKAINEWRSPSV
jgi:NDP-sugar pyrophosphorylase family protein